MFCYNLWDPINLEKEKLCDLKDDFWRWKNVCLQGSWEWQENKIHRSFIAGSLWGQKEIEAFSHIMRELCLMGLGEHKSPNGAEQEWTFPFDLVIWLLLGVAQYHQFNLWEASKPKHCFGPPVSKAQAWGRMDLKLFWDGKCLCFQVPIVLK